jgi:hypothetical protein
MRHEESDAVRRFGELDRSRPRRAADGHAITGLRCPVAGGEKGDVHNGATQPICRDRKSGDDAAFPCEANPHALAQSRNAATVPPRLFGRGVGSR